MYNAFIDELIKISGAMGTAVQKSFMSRLGEGASGLMSSLGRKMTPTVTAAPKAVARPMKPVAKKSWTEGLNVGMTPEKIRDAATRSQLRGTLATAY